ncbi:MAG TPA: hypothetical protein VG841_06205 [Caulobacterales bacterium]|nr:hypothetical protein [Caulobacterales bacterium]
MLRYIAVFAVLLLASPGFAEPKRAAPPRDPFVISVDACGASRCAHLVGRSYKLEQASLPAHAVIHGGADAGAVPVAGAARQSAGARMLEYRPQRLDIVVDGAWRIVSVGCH